MKIFAVFLIFAIGAPYAIEATFESIGSVGGKTFLTSPEAAGLSWIESQEFCNQNGTLGMRLAAIETEAELSLVMRTTSSRGIEFWLSATDFGSEGVFHWTATGRPVLHAVRQDGGRVENCLAVQADGNLSDQKCTGHQSDDLWALCEIIGDEPPEPTPLPPFECRSEGKFPDPEQCDVFHECVAYQGSFIDHVFTCPEFTNYCPDQEQCGHPDECPCKGSRASAPQESHAPVPAPERTDQLEYVGKVGTKEFYTFRPPAPYFNWIESMEFCHRNGLMLARMETEAERGMLVTYLGVGGSGTYRYFWLGAVDYGSEGKYYWFGSEAPVERPIYGNGGRHSNCLYLASTGPVYDWTCEYNRWATTWPLCQLEEAERSA